MSGAVPEPPSKSTEEADCDGCEHEQENFHNHPTRIELVLFRTRKTNAFINFRRWRVSVMALVTQHILQVTR